jgi:polyphosphate kinase 2 (PPK2 family)
MSKKKKGKEAKEKAAENQNEIVVAIDDEGVPEEKGKKIDKKTYEKELRNLQVELVKASALD